MSWYPGSVAVSSNTIRIAPGALVTLPIGWPEDKPVAAEPPSTISPSPTTSTRPAPPPRPGPRNTSKPPEPAYSPNTDYFNCPYYYICVFSDEYAQGYRLALYYCQFSDLSTYNYPGGGVWNDKTSSWSDNQTQNTVAYMYNWDGSTYWALIYGPIYAPSYTGLLGPNNNIIDAVDPC